MVVAIDLVHIVVAKCSAHHHPHHHFYAFGAGKCGVFLVLDVAQTLWILRQVIEKCGIEFTIDHA